VRLFGYDTVVERFRLALDEQAKQGGRRFNEIFPEPPGIAEHRARMEERMKERDRLPGVELK
jgi:hypothetical protein